VPALTRAEAVEIDRAARAQFGMPALLLMEAAGRAVARVTEAEITAFRTPTTPTPTPTPAAVVVVAGPGNNGGDGLVAARTLRNRLAVPVECVLVGSAARLARSGEEARVQLDLVTRLGIPVRRLAEPSDVPAARTAIERKDVVLIDALFGIGQKGAASGVESEAIRAINRSGARIVAVDVPSGLDSDLGLPLGEAVRAAITVTFGAPKRGLLTHTGRAYAGRIAVAEIGFPKELLGLELRSAQPEIAWVPEEAS